MAADWQGDAKRRFERLPPAQREQFLPRHGMESYKPTFSIPPGIPECKDGLCVFSHPEIGLEIMRGFNDTLSGLRKKGLGLMQDEREALHGWVESTSISPGFVKRFVREHAAESML